MVPVLMPLRVVLDDDRSRLDGDRDHRSDFGLLTGVQRIVHQLLQHDERPLLDAVPGLVLQFPPGAEFHQPRNLKATRVSFGCCFSLRFFRFFRPGFATICKNRDFRSAVLAC